MKINIYSLSRHHMFQTAKCLHEDGHEVTLITGYPKNYASKYVDCSVRTTNLEALRLLFRRVLGETTAFYTAELVVFVLHSFLVRIISKPEQLNIYSADLFPFMFIDRKHKCKWVMDRGSTHYTYHKDAVGKTGFVHRLKERLSIADYDFSDLIIVPSKFVASTFEDYGAKVAIVPYSIDTSLFATRSRSRKITRAKPRILFAGTANYRKGFDRFKELAKILPEFQFEQVGGNDGVKSDQIVQHGHLSERALTSLYNEIDIVCLMSREEGQSLMLMQALQLEIPVIATEQCGVGEFIDSTTGYLLGSPDEVTADAFRQAVAACVSASQQESSYCSNAGRVTSWNERARLVLKTAK